MPKAPAEPNQVYIFGPYLYDIDKALRLVAKNPDRPTHPLDVKQWARSILVEKTMQEYLAEGRLPLLRGEIDEEFARTQADLSVPVIIGDLRIRDEGSPGYMLIDGAHRLRRAYLEGVDSLDAYVLDLKETRSIRRARPRR